MNLWEEILQLEFHCLMKFMTPQIDEGVSSKKYRSRPKFINATDLKLFRVWSQWSKHVSYEHAINSHLRALSHWHGLIRLPQWKKHIFVSHYGGNANTLTAQWKLTATLMCIFMQMLQREWQRRNAVYSSLSIIWAEQCMRTASKHGGS